MKRIEVTCDECGCRSVTFVDVTDEDRATAEATIANQQFMPLSEEDLAWAQQVAQKHIDTHVVCGSCGFFTQKVPQHGP